MRAYILEKSKQIHGLGSAAQTLCVLTVIAPPLLFQQKDILIMLSLHKHWTGTLFFIWNGIQSESSMSSSSAEKNDHHHRKKIVENPEKNAFIFFSTGFWTGEKASFFIKTGFGFVLACFAFAFHVKFA